MKKFDFPDYFHKAAEKLAALLPDWITGKSDVMKQKYCMKYGARDYSHLIKRNKANTMAAYMIIGAFFIIFSFAALPGQLTKREEITSVERPAFGEATKSIPVEAHVKFNDYELIRSMTIRVSQKEPDEKEKRELINSYMAWLEEMILGENEDPDHISRSLNLVDQDTATGITVNWISDHPELINEKGEVDLIGAKDGQAVELRAELALDDVSVTKVYRFRLDTNAVKEDYEKSMAGRLDESIVRSAAAADSPDMALPRELGDGVRVRWYAGKEDGGPFLAFIFFFALIIVYLKRYDPVNREIRKAEESIAQDLPEFINKLVLLLNAGLVVSTAFSKIAEDYEMFYHSGKPEKERKKRYLYEELIEIQKRVNRSNASLIRELKEFSQRCGVREMVRLTTVISDNWNKGSALSEKLEGEAELMWIGRKKRAEEKGRLAETKLTLPLMILLMVLIMVTIAPAMLEM